MLFEWIVWNSLSKTERSLGFGAASQSGSADAYVGKGSKRLTNPLGPKPLNSVPALDPVIRRGLVESKSVSGKFEAVSLQDSTSFPFAASTPHPVFNP